MTLSSSLLMYEDVMAILDQALDADVGLSINFPKIGDAIHFRQRCYKFRTLARKIAETYDDDDPRKGNSAYDAIVVYIRKTTCEIRKRDTIHYEIRELKV